MFIVIETLSEVSELAYSAREAPSVSFCFSGCREFVLEAEQQ